MHFYQMFNMESAVISIVAYAVVKKGKTRDLSVSIVFLSTYNNFLYILTIKYE